MTLREFLLTNYEKHQKNDVVFFCRGGQEIRYRQEKMASWQVTESTVLFFKDTGSGESAPVVAINIDDLVAAHLSADFGGRSL